MLEVQATKKFVLSVVVSNNKVGVGGITPSRRKPLENWSGALRTRQILQISA